MRLQLAAELLAPRVVVEVVHLACFHVDQLAHLVPESLLLLVFVSYLEFLVSLIKRLEELFGLLLHDLDE